MEQTSIVENTSIGILPMVGFRYSKKGFDKIDMSKVKDTDIAFDEKNKQIYARGVYYNCPDFLGELNSIEDLLNAKGNVVVSANQLYTILKSISDRIAILEKTAAGSISDLPSYDPTKNSVESSEDIKLFLDKDESVIPETISVEDPSTGEMEEEITDYKVFTLSAPNVTIN